MLLAKGDACTATARRLGMSHDALARHWKRHVPEAHKKALLPGAAALAARDELAGQIAEENSSSLEHLQAVRAMLWRILLDAKARGKTMPAVFAAGQYTKTCGLIAKMTGELASSPLVQNTTFNVGFTSNPDFLRLMDDVAKVLDDYPEARRAVFEKLAALERQDDRVIDAPALVHHADTAAA